jgi:hypothetical protein
MKAKAWYQRRGGIIGDAEDQEFNRQQTGGLIDQTAPDKPEPKPEPPPEPKEWENLFA